MKLLICSGSVFIVPFLSSDIHLNNSTISNCRFTSTMKTPAKFLIWCILIEAVITFATTYSQDRYCLAIFIIILCHYEKNSKLYISSFAFIDFYFM